MLPLKAAAERVEAGPRAGWPRIDEGPDEDPRAETGVRQGIRVWRRVDAKHLDLRLGRNAGGSLLDDIGEAMVRDDQPEPAVLARPLDRAAYELGLRDLPEARGHGVAASCSSRGRMVG